MYENSDQYYQTYIDDSRNISEIRPYTLIDVDCSGFLEIDRDDEHPNSELTDDIALAVCEQDADAGDELALAYIMAHEYHARMIANHFGYPKVSASRFY
jgi:hypothetical protein